MGKTGGDPSSGGWLGWDAAGVLTTGCLGKVAAILNIRGDQSMLCWLTLVPAGLLCLPSVSRMRSAFLLSGPRIQTLGVPFFEVCLSLGHYSVLCDQALYVLCCLNF